jgi:hypothetical protein
VHIVRTAIKGFAIAEKVVLPIMNQPVQHSGGQPEEALTAMGDIVVSQHWVSTPTGVYPIRGTIWTVADMSHWQERMSPAGIILCILFIWACFLSLFFLLMKERSVDGYIQVTVQGNGFHYSTLIPARLEPMAGVQQRVNYARGLAAAAT